MREYHPLDVRYTGPSTAYRGSQPLAESTPKPRAKASASPWGPKAAASPLAAAKRRARKKAKSTDGTATTGRKKLTITLQIFACVIVYLAISGVIPTPFSAPQTLNIIPRP